MDAKERAVQHASHKMLSDTDVTNDDAVGLVQAAGKLASLVGGGPGGGGGRALLSCVPI